MLESESTQTTWTPGRVFYIGLAIILLANWLPFIPAWSTFVHMWRVEIAASIFLVCVLSYLLINSARISFRCSIGPVEWRFVVLPILAFILWSSLSTLWAPSWKSAIHHSLIWAEYLIFYLIFRELLERKENLPNLLLVFLVALALYALPAVAEYCAYLAFGGQTTLGMRYAKYGEQIVTFLPLVLLAVVRMRGRQFVIGASVVTLLWLLVFCSLGRINYFLFGALIVCVLTGLIISSRHRRYVPRYALLVLVLALAPLPLHLFSLFSNETSVPVIARFSNSEGLNSSNNFRKLMMSVSGEMVGAHPWTGVGADNFGMQVNRYREIYGSSHPDDVNLASAEDQIPERAHNEFLQIVAELGIIGGVIFAWLLAGVAIMAFRAIRTVRVGSLTAASAMLGVVMFLVSSMVSAYSFRVMQNGIVFFFVLAVAAKEIFSASRSESEQPARIFSPPWLKPAIAAGILICIGLISYSALRVSSVIVTGRAIQTRPLTTAMPLYELAMRLDDENPDVRVDLGMRLFRSRRYQEAIPYLESAISIGRAPSAELSYLATTRTFAGDLGGAEQTMSEAASLYPRSPFVLTRYATLLELNGKHDESAEMFARAVKIDERSARTWRVLIDSGPMALTDMAARDTQYGFPMDLSPKSSIYAVVTERLIRHPEEQRFSYGKLSEEEE